MLNQITFQPYNLSFQQVSTPHSKNNQNHYVSFNLGQREYI